MNLQRTSDRLLQRRIAVGGGMLQAPMLDGPVIDSPTRGMPFSNPRAPQLLLLRREIEV